MQHATASLEDPRSAKMCQTCRSSMFFNDHLVKKSSTHNPKPSMLSKHTGDIWPVKPQALSSRPKAKLSKLLDLAIDPLAWQTQDLDHTYPKYSISPAYPTPSHDIIYIYNRVVCIQIPYFRAPFSLDFDLLGFPAWRSGPALPSSWPWAQPEGYTRHQFSCLNRQPASTCINRLYESLLIVY